MTLESLLSQPMKATDLSRLTGRPLEDVYERLVHLEALGIVVLTYVKGCRKTNKGHTAHYQWVMA